MRYALGYVFVLALFVTSIGAFAAGTGAKKINLDFAKQDPNSPEALYAMQRGYSKESAQAAYVTQRLIGAYLEYQGNGASRANPEDLRIKLQDAFNDAVTTVKGASYRGGDTEALLKISGKALAAVAAKKGLILPTDYLVEKGLDYMATPPQELAKQEYSVILGTNVFMLQNMDEKDGLAPFLQKTALLFNPDLNPSQSLLYEPSVVKQVIANTNQQTLNHIGLLGDKSLTNTKQILANQDNQNTVLSGISSKLDDTKEDLSKLAGDMQDEHAKAEIKARMESDKVMMQNLFGIAYGMAVISGDKDAARAINTMGHIVVSAFNVGQAFASSTSEGWISMCMFAVTMIVDGQELMSDPAGDSMSKAFTQLNDKLFAIQKQIAQLGAVMEARFDILDRTLQQYVHESNQRMTQMISSGQRTEADGRFFSTMLKTISQNSYGSYLFMSDLTWIQAQHDCFPSAPRVLDKDMFRLCRNEMALFAINGPPMQAGHRSFAPEAMNALIQRLTPALNLPSLPDNSQPDPASWLQATHTLLTLAQYHPEFSPVMKEQTFDEATQLSLGSVLQIGGYYQQLIHQMAVINPDSDSPKLRRDTPPRY